MKRNPDRIESAVFWGGACVISLMPFIWIALVGGLVSWLAAVVELPPFLPTLDDEDQP